MTILFLKTLIDICDRKNVQLALDPIVHEKYNGNLADGHDIALLKLAENVDLTVYTPACLPKSGADYTGKTGKVCGELDNEMFYRMRRIHANMCLKA